MLAVPNDLVLRQFAGRKNLQKQRAEIITWNVAGISMIILRGISNYTLSQYHHYYIMLLGSSSSGDVQMDL